MAVSLRVLGEMANQFLDGNPSRRLAIIATESVNVHGFHRHLRRPLMTPFLHWGTRRHSTARKTARKTRYRFPTHQTRTLLQQQQKPRPALHAKNSQPIGRGWGCCRLAWNSTKNGSRANTDPRGNFPCFTPRIGVTISASCFFSFSLPSPRPSVAKSW